MTQRTTPLGDCSSATQRILNFAERWRDYMGEPPRVVVAFAEDYDALDLSAFERQPYRVERGPSVEEYR
jgi:hypothetical protein